MSSGSTFTCSTLDITSAGIGYQVACVVVVLGIVAVGLEGGDDATIIDARHAARFREAGKLGGRSCCERVPAELSLVRSAPSAPSTADRFDAIESLAEFVVAVAEVDRFGELSDIEFALSNGVSLLGARPSVGMFDTSSD